MKTVHLMHFSPGGTTRKTLQNIASGMKNVKIVEHDMLVESNRKKKYFIPPDELLILGVMTATKIFGFAQEILESISGNNTPAAGVVLYGNGYYGNSLKILRHEIEKRGFKMAAGGAFIGQHSFEPSIAANRPDENDCKIQVDFGAKLEQKVFIDKDYSFNSKLKIDWPETGFSMKAKCALLLALPGISTPKIPTSWCIKNISDDCILCGRCERKCPTGAINIKEKSIDYRKCIGCNACANICPQNAIQFTNPMLIKIMEKCKNSRQQRREPETYF